MDRVTAKIDLMQSLQIDVQDLLQESQYVDSIQYTIDMEYEGGRLTHVNDQLYLLFLAVEKERKKFHTVKDFDVHLDNTPNIIMEKLLNSKPLKEIWMSLFPANLCAQSSILSPDSSRSMAEQVKILLFHLSDRAANLSDLYSMVIRIYMRVAHNQLRKDVLRVYGKVTKGALRDSLRGKIQPSGKGKRKGRKAVQPKGKVRAAPAQPGEPSTSAEVSESTDDVARCDGCYTPRQVVLPCTACTESFCQDCSALTPRRFNQLKTSSTEEFFFCLSCEDL